MMRRCLFSLVVSAVLWGSSPRLWAAGLPVAALELLSAGHADEAVAALRTHLQTDPRDAAAHALLMRAYFAMQQWDDAIAQGRQAAALDPQNSQYHLWLGRAYGEKANQSNWVIAVSLARKTRMEFETAVALDRRNLDARSDLAEYYVEAPMFLGGSKNKAQDQADQLWALGDQTTSLWIRAKIAESAGHYNLAEQELRAAIRISHNRPNIILNLAQFYRRRGRLADMEATVNQAALAAGTDDSHILLDAAQLLYDGGRNFTGAVAMLHDYINSPRHSEDAPVFQAYYLLGCILEKLGDRPAATRQYRAALSLARAFEPAQTALQRVQ